MTVEDWANYECAGIINANSSKTTSAMVEAARAFVGKDPFEKYPKRAGIYFVFGIDSKHIGSVIYKKLFRAGAFKMIRDPKSMLWRAFDPVADAARIKEAKPAPPLIPPRMIDWVVWDQKRAGIPACVVLRNGTEIHFFSINAEMPRGQDIDGAFIDEEAVKSGIIAEIMARLVDRGGRLVWSATPQSGGDQLFDLMEAAGSTDVDLFHAHILDNPHIAEEEKDIFYRNLSEDERRVRWHGEPMLSGFTVYPEFSRVVHSFPEARGWQPPDDWARYISVDPGRQVCYVSFLAVPPPWVGNFVVVHDELHLEKCDAEMFGRELGLKSQHGVTYEAALIDGNQCRVSDMGSGKSIEDQYRNAMFKHGVRVRTGGFTWGADDLAPGIEAVHTWLRIGSNGTPYMRILVENCPWLCREMMKYRYVKDQHGMPSNKVVKKNDHSCFVAGTMIATPTGDVPIESLRLGDPIITHLGIGCVEGLLIEDDKEVVEVTSLDGEVVVCTPDHPFAITGGAWEPAEQIEGRPVWRRRTHGSTASDIILAKRQATTKLAGRTTLATKIAANCIRRFGSFITAQLNRGCTFITRTRSKPTTTSATSNCSRPKSTWPNTPTILTWRERPLKNGTEASPVLNGIASTCETSKPAWNLSRTSVSDAASPLNPRSDAEWPTVLTIASATLERNPASMTSINPASIAEPLTEPIAIKRRGIAPQNVETQIIQSVSPPLPEKRRVYNLATSDGTYFANGFLVSNCDVVRYFAMCNPRWVRPLARIKKDKFSSYENFQARKKAKAARHGGGQGGVIKFGMGTQ